MAKEKQILQLFADGKSQRRIVTVLAVSRNTVPAVVTAAKRTGRSFPDLLRMEKTDLYHLLFPKKAAASVQVVPDYEKIHMDLLKDGVTLAYLWEEYCNECRTAKKPPYMYSQFCKLYSDYVDQYRLTMHIRHKSADKLMVDWAGTKFSYYDTDGTREQTCQLFVTTLPFSMYCYAEAFSDMKQGLWINAHVHMYSHLGGCTRFLFCDNLKTGVTSNRKHEDPMFNKSYEELAGHYHITSNGYEINIDGDVSVKRRHSRL